jgi:hypothetical protein
MLTHIVCWRYKEETTSAQREQHRAKLRNLKNVIAEIVDLQIGADVLHLERSYDTGLIANFKSLEDLSIYTENSVHIEAAHFGKQIAAHVVSVDFEN